MNLTFFGLCLMYGCILEEHVDERLFKSAARQPDIIQCSLMIMGYLY